MISVPRIRARTTTEWYRLGASLAVLGVAHHLQGNARFSLYSPAFPPKLYPLPPPPDLDLGSGGEVPYLAHFVECARSTGCRPVCALGMSRLPSERCMKRSAALLIVVVLLAALGARLAAAWWWQSRLPGRFFFGDSESYWVLGQAIAHGGPYEYGSPDARVFRAPGYPLVLAPLFVLGGDELPVLWARVLGAVLGTAAVGGVGWLAWR